jgi:signal peptidase I
MNAAAAAAPALMREAIERFGTARMRAYGGSMAPAIQPGDLLHIERARPRDLRPGDVILFERDGRLFAHRVVRWHRRRLITRGDAHFRSDPPIDADQIVGIVTIASRDGGDADFRKSAKTRMLAGAMRILWIRAKTRMRRG